MAQPYRRKDNTGHPCSQIESISVNINQIAKRVNSTGTIYAEDMRQIKNGQEEIWQLIKKLLSKLV